MKLHLFAHNNTNFVKVGDKVKAYDKPIAEIGTAFGAYYAHLHHSISEGLTPEELFAYVRFWKLEKVLQFYKNPKDEGVDYDRMFGKKMDVGNRGWGFAQSMSKLYNYFHPGQDINGVLGGNTDLGYDYTSPINGTVIYSKNAGSGWGNVILIEEHNSEPECNHKCHKCCK